MISSIEQVPPHGKIVKIIVDDDLAKSMVVLEHEDFENNQTVIILKTIEATKLKGWRQVPTELRKLKYKPQLLEASVDLIRVLSGDASNDEQEKETHVVKDGDAKERLDTLVQNAMNTRTSDIHFRMTGEKAEVKFRVDGSLQSHATMKASDMRTFLQTIYTSYSEDREHSVYKDNVDQFSMIEGSYFLKQPYITKKGHTFIPKMVDVKLRKQSQSLNGNDGDEVWRVIIPDDGSGLPDPTDLGYLPIQLEILNEMLRKTAGAILICGTTGAGKSVSQAAFLNLVQELYDGEKNIRTVENPVEYNIPNVQQASIIDIEKIGDSLKTNLRMDPDILGIGEIRDVQTAKLSAGMALSGHPLWGTMHTADAATTITRLAEYGIDRSVMGEKNFLTGIICQSLIKTVCQTCAVPFTESKERLDKGLVSALEKTKYQDLSLLKGIGEGCSECKGGITGRTLIAEVVSVTTKMKALLRNGLTNEAIDYWQNEHFYCVNKANPKTKLDHALYLMEQGIVTPQAVMTACGELTKDVH
jgi:type II secretory ATPase GspE/PulE/Tfp pilus assembly ATPase PilB-like protein